MSTKKTNLGKMFHQYETLEELFECINNDVTTFQDEVNAILKQFDPYNPYDVGVLKVLLGRTLASLSVGLESEYPDFEEQVLALCRAVKDEHRATLKKMVENGEIEAYEEALRKRRIQRMAESMKD